ncbi:MAG: hypothetical protein Q7J34_02205 [Bacteroidales bacterium]|jgi:hypothetical protein|nr:hypothetical protein [Bacteroidales bacterium]
MDEFLYILAIIAWIGFSFFQNYKKKANAREKAGKGAMPSDNPEPVYEQKEESSDYGDVLSEIFGIPVPPKKVEVLPKPGFSEGMGVDEIKPKSMLDGMKKSYESIEYQNIKISSTDNVVEVDDREPLISADEFDLKKALIYSVILERPYK